MKTKTVTVIESAGELVSVVAAHTAKIRMKNDDSPFHDIEIELHGAIASLGGPDAGFYEMPDDIASTDVIRAIAKRAKVPLNDLVFTE